MSTSGELRVAIVLSELRPGGMERVVVHLARGLASRKAPVLVICLQGAGLLAGELANTEVQLVSLNSFSGRDFHAVWHLKKELGRFRPTVINVHDYASLPYAVAANTIAGRVPVLFTAHGFLYEGFDTTRPRNRFFARFLTALSAVTDKVAERHRDYLGWRKPIEIIANGVPATGGDKASRLKARASLGCEPDTFLWLTVGNPRPEKACEDLIDALALLREAKNVARNFKVVVAGALKDDDYCRMLQRRLDERQVQDCISFLGFREDTPALYAAADAFVLSSRSEGLPMVVLEAMMAGLPVMATRVGGIPDAVGDQVLLVDPAQTQQLAQAMERLMSDRSLREELAVKGQVHVEQTFGVERMVAGYVGWYKSVVQGA